MGKWNRIRRNPAVLLGVSWLMALLFAFSAYAGWSQTADGRNTFTDARGQTVTGLQTIDGSTYLFDKDGCLQTGWVSTEDGFRYFQEQGQAGSGLGAMVFGGVFTISNERYGFGENGVVLAGYHAFPGGNYYFSTSQRLSERGKAVKEQFVDLPDGRRAYFNADGLMVFNKWIKKHKYYIDETGNLLRNSVTKDGYVLKANGKVKKKLSKTQFIKISGKWYFYKKKKGLLKDKVFKYNKNYYYVDENGIRKKGWVSWNGYQYYFGSGGKAVTGKKKIGGTTYSFDKKGRLKDSKAGTKAITGTATVLIMCGHGQGDSGAVGCGGKYVESTYTRDFGERVYKALQKIQGINVELYNKKYDMYQQVRKVAGSYSFKGNGKKKKKLLSKLKKNSNIPDLTKYDYALEIHFNATAASGKDPKGNGKKKGTGTYVNSYKSSDARKVDKKIISALNGVGLNTWGSGVYGSSTLLNAKTFTELGVNYSLLETCFIDDLDDMKFYLKKRDDMADAVAGAIADFLG